jgi:lambda family phage tail tape measure protein
VQQRAQDVQQNLGILEKAWNGVTGAAKGAWDAMLDVGRPATIDDKIKAVQDKLTQAQDQLRTGQRGTIGLSASQINAGLQAQQIDPDQVRKEIADLKAQLNNLQFQKLTGGNIFAAGQSLANREIGDRIAAQQALSTGAGASAQSTLNARLNELAEQKAKALMGVVDPDKRQQIIDQFNAQVAEAAHQYDSAIKKLTPHTGGGSSGKTADDYIASFQDTYAKMNAKGADALNAQTAAQAKAQVGNEAYAQQLATQLQLRENAINLQVQAVGMGQKEIQRMQEKNQVYLEFNRQLKQLNEERDRGSISIAYYNTRMQDMKYAEGATIAALEDGWERLDKAQSSAMLGLISGMQNWIDQGRDVAGMVSQSFTDAFGSMNDALVNFVQTGKLNFADLGKSIIADLTRMELRIAESQILEAILGAFMPSATGIASSYMAGGGATYAASGVNWNVGYLGGGRAMGGQVLPGSIHPVVENGPELLSTPQGTYLMMGDTGGQVEPLGRPLKGGAGAGGNVYLNVEVKGGDGNAKVSKSESTDGQGNKLISLVIDQAASRAVSEVNKNIVRGGSTGQAIQQVFGLSRRGIPVAG